MSTPTLLEPIAEVLRRMELEHSLDPEHDLAHASIDLADGCVEFIAHFDPECRVHELVVRFPLFARKEQQTRCAEFTCRHNITVSKLTLCYNPDGGSMGLRLAFNRDANGSINGDLLECATHHMLRHADNLFPCLLRLLAGNEQPSTLIEQFEARLAAMSQPDEATPPEQA